MRLTQRLVDAMGLGGDRVVWDDETPGLGVRVQSGRRTWIVRYRVAGVQRQKSLPGALPLRRARAHAAEIRAGATRGNDVVADGRAASAAARREAEAARARSLGAMVERYLVDAAKRLRPSSLRLARSYLNRHWSPLHDRPADDLGRRDLMAILEPYAGRVTAGQALAHLSACLTWGVDRGLLERNAALGVKAPVERRSRERVLTEAEIKTLWSATAGEGAGKVDGRYFAIVRLLLLTGQRRDEVGGVPRSELDLDRAHWSLPGERAKNGLPHGVPLSSQAAGILRAALAQGEGEHVFGGRGFGDWSRCKARLDAVVKLPPWTLHDLRRTAVTGMVEIGVAPHVVEAVVNHVSGHKGGVAGVYNRATYAAEKRAALQQWADHVERVVAGEDSSNVVAFGR
jgi:integrase